MVRQPGKPGVVHRVWKRFAGAVRWAARRQKQQAPGLGPAAIPTPGSPAAEGSQSLAPGASLLGTPGHLSGPESLSSAGMQSPFDVGADSLGFSATADSSGGSSFALQTPSSMATAASPARRLLPLYRHTMLRLRTTSFEAVAAEAVAAAEQRRLEEVIMESGGEQPQTSGGPVGGAGASSDGGGSCGGGASLEPPLGEAQQLGATQRQLDVQLAQRFYPMLTPSGCTRQLPITPQEAAGIYTGVCTSTVQ